MKQKLLGAGAAILIGVALRFVLNLDPVWWLAWFAPGLLLALALRFEGWTARGLVVLAAAIGASVNFGYFRAVMPLPSVLIVLTLQTLLWLLLIGFSRRVVLAFRTGWTILALPVITVAVDTALAHFTPDGNWGGLGYTQADVLPVAQLASLLGVPGMLFVLMLFNSAIALAIHFQLELRGAKVAYAMAATALAATAAFGWWRLQAPVTGPEVGFGIASVDDFIGDSASPLAQGVWSRYDTQVRELASDGARIVLLPEKIDVVSPNEARARQGSLGELAASSHVWLVAGLGVDDAGVRRNEAWWYAPDGRLVTNYRKHFMAPPEREFVPGSEFPTNEIDGLRYGVAICKDMHFASLGRDFAARDAAVMLVPAWDFEVDKRYAMNITKLRGIESGFSIVRSSRDGLLTISDAYGRVLAASDSATLPGTSMVAKVSIGPRVQTFYARIGDALGWLCLAAVPLLLAWPRKAA